MTTVIKELTAKVLEETFWCDGNALYPDCLTLKTSQCERKNTFIFAKGRFPPLGSEIIYTLINELLNMFQ